MQVTTFKVRTVRAKREIESLASRWAQGSDNNLDDAAGDCHALLARAMSVSAASAWPDPPYLLSPLSPIRLMSQKMSRIGLV